MTISGMMMNKNKFSKSIEEIVRYKNLSYIDAVLYFCEKNKLDEEDVRNTFQDQLGVRSKQRQ